MLALKHFRDKAAGVSDLLNWAALIDNGVVLCKDGSLLAGYFYRGKDTSSATDVERNYLTTRVNNALARLGNGWVTWHDAVRLPADDYPSATASHFQDPITALIEAERRQQFTAEGQHFESTYVLIFSYTPPLRRESKIVDLLYDDDPDHPVTPANRILDQFNTTLTSIEDALGDAISLRRMESYTTTDTQGRSNFRDELVDYLHFSLTGIAHPVNLPPDGMYLDNVIGGQELWPGDTPRIGQNIICCVAIEGFPHESYPNILDVLESLPIAYRWSTRMMYLDQHSALGELKKYRRKWRQKVRGFWSQVFRTQGGIVNEDALFMANQTETAMTDANSALVTFGYYTPVIVLMGEDRSTLLESARTLVREVQREGFACRIETINTMEAWMGSLPGHPYPNIRRALLHTLNLADLLPLSCIWAGQHTAPSPLYPENVPPLLYAATHGATPFRLNLHVGDVGHTLVFGPTGAGKSTLLATLAAQFRRYKNANIYAFDKGRSLWTLVHAANGRHYDIATDGQNLSFSPITHLDTDGDLAWAEEWIATCFSIQTQQAPTPQQRESIHRALQLLRNDTRPGTRSLTDFCATVQDATIRSALSYYTLSGALGHLLDSQQDGLTETDFCVFEIEELMALGDKAAIPVLLYLFRRFERSLNGQPALLLLDEAWIMLGHPVFREKIREWLKTLRKANCAVVLATQSLSDAARSGIYDVLIESCPTKILLPNEEADKRGSGDHPGPYDLYTMMGLNDTEITLLKTAAKKRHYYFRSPEGRRLFDLGLGPIALSFVAVSDRETLNHLKSLKDHHPHEWPWLWLQERKVQYDTLQA